MAMAKERISFDTFFNNFSSPSTISVSFSIRPNPIMIADDEGQLNGILSARHSVGRWKKKKMFTSLYHWCQWNNQYHRPPIGLLFLAICTGGIRNCFFYEKSPSYCCLRCCLTLLLPSALHFPAHHKKHMLLLVEHSLAILAKSQFPAEVSIIGININCTMSRS